MPDSGLERRQTSSCFRECTRCRCFPLSVRALLPLIFALVFWSCTMAAALFFGNALYDQRLSEKPFKDSGFKWSFDWKGALGPANPKLFVCAAGSPDSFFSMRVEDASITTTTPTPSTTSTAALLHPLVEFAHSFNSRKASVDFTDDELDHIALLANEGVAYAENTRDVYPFPFELNNYYAAAHFFMLLVFVVFQGRRAPIVLKRLLLLLAASQVLFHVQLTVTQFPDPLLPCLPFASEAVSSPTLIVTTPDGGASVSHVSVSNSDLNDDTTTTTTVPPAPLGIEDTKDGYTWRLSGPRQWLYSNQPAQYTIGALLVQFYCTSWPVRIFSWIVAIAGIFVLVPTHYLYTVDVMTGVICALSVFLMYHWSVRTTLSIEKRWWIRWLEYDQVCLQRYGRLLLCGSGSPTNGEDNQLLRGSSPSGNNNDPHNNTTSGSSINRYSAPVTPGEARILGGGGSGGNSPTDSRQKGTTERRKRGSSGNQSMATIATSSPHIPIQERLTNNRLSPREQDEVDSNHGHDDDNSLSSNDIVAEAVVEAGAITHHRDTERARTSSSLGANGSNNKNSKRCSRKNSSQGGGPATAMDGGEDNAADFAPQSAYGKIQRAAIIQHEENVRAIQRRPSNNNNISAASPNELYATGNSGAGGFGASITIPGAGPQLAGYHDENGFYHESYELTSSDYALEHFRVPTLTLVDKARFLTLILDEVEHEFYSVFSPHVPIQDIPSQPIGVTTEATSTNNTPANREDDNNNNTTDADRVSNKNSILGSRQSEGYFSCASGPSQGGGGGGGGGTSSNTSSKGLGSRRSSAQSMPEEDSDEDTTYFRNRNTSGGPVQHVLGTVSDRPRAEDSSPLGPPLTSFSVKEGKESIRIRTDSVRHSTLVEGIAPVVVPAMSEDDQEAILYKLWLRRWFIILLMGVLSGGSGAASAFINIISINVADTNRPIGIPLPPDVIFHFLPAVPPHTPDFLLYSQVAAVFIYMGLSRYRFVMIRRAALMYGICMMGRCLTVPATFPIDPSILCKARIHPEGTTCGDLIYSGHTIAFIVSLAVILKYVRPLWVRAGFCAYTLCGLVAVVTSRLHYTRDVLTAVLVTGTVYYLCHRTLFHRYDLFLRHPRLRFLELDYFSILVEDRALAQQGKTRRYLWIKGSVGETFGSIADAWEKRKRRQERERRRRQGEV